jgi:hypothetical protein
MGVKGKEETFTAHIDARITICANNIRESKIKLFILEKLVMYLILTEPKLGL